MAIKENTFEGGTAATTITTANSGGTSGDAFDTVNLDSNTIEFSSTHTAHGALSMRCMTGATAGSPYVIWSTGVSGTTLYERVYLYLTAMPAGNTNLLRMMAGSTTVATLRINSAGKLGVLYAAGTVGGTSTTTVPIGAWFRIEYRVTTANTAVGSVEARLFTGADDVTPAETILVSNVNTASAGPITVTRMGLLSSMSNVEMWIDEPAWSDAGWIGPYSAGGGTPTAITDAQSVAFTDAATRSLSASRNDTNTAALADSTSRSQSTVRDGVDALTLADAATSTGGTTVTVADALAAADVATRARSTVRGTADALAAADSATRARSTVRGAADALAAADSATRSVALSRAAGDSAGLADMTTRTRSAVIAATDSVTLADAATATGGIAVAATDTLVAADSAVRSVAIARTAADGVSLDGTATRAGLTGRSATDGATFTDAATTATATAVVVSDSGSVRLADSTAVTVRPAALVAAGAHHITMSSPVAVISIAAQAGAISRTTGLLSTTRRSV